MIYTNRLSYNCTNRKPVHTSPFQVIKVMILIIYLLLLSCFHPDKQTVAFLDEGLDNNSHAIGLLNDRLSQQTELAYVENPAKNYKYKAESDSLLKCSQNLSHLLSIAAENKWNEGITAKNFSFLLDSSIKQYIGLLNDFLQKDSVIRKKSVSILRYIDIVQSDNKKPKITQLKTLVKTAEYEVLSYYLSRMEPVQFKPDTTEVVVIPKNRYLHSGEVFEAQIYLVSTGTKSINSLVKIEGYPVLMKSGKAIFIDSLAYRSGHKKKEGVLVLKGPVSDYSKEYPFTIDYQFIEK